MHIGLIGGIGPAATDYYYRRLIGEFARLEEALELTMVHADAPTLLANLANDDKAAQTAIYNALTARLVAAGADCVVVTSIAGHFCIEEFKRPSPLPVIDMLTEVNVAIKARGYSRVGILGTATVMETGFYSGIESAKVIAPDREMLRQVHTAYATMATTGFVTDAQRSVFDDACKQLIHQEQVESIVLGGTDLALVYNEEDSPYPVVDCAGIHTAAIARYAIECE